jgi:hypothetical protein
MTTAFLITSIFIMLVITFAATIFNRTSFDFRSRAVYPTNTPTRTPTPIPRYSYGMVYYNQTDRPWGSISIEGGKCTFASVGCGTTVTASVFSTRKSLIWRPDYTYTQIYKGYLTCSGFGAQDVYTRLTQKGISLTQLTGSGNQKKAQVESKVKAGKKVIVGANVKKFNGTVISHVTLAVGYSNAKQAIIYNDPLFGAGVTLEADPFKYTIDWANALPYMLN